MNSSDVAPMPTVSVIIPTCNRQELVLDCIESILRNDFADFEILVIDQDPSQRLRAELVRRFQDARIRYFFLQVAALDRARNLGIDQANGRILIFVDDDVEVEPAWLRSYVEAFVAVEPQPGVVAGRLDPLWMVEKPAWLPKEREYVYGLYNQNDCDDLAPLPEGYLPIGANFAVLRDVVLAVGRFDDRLDYSYDRKTSLISGGDSLFSLRIKQANYPLYFQPYARAWHKISKNKLTARYFLKRNFWEGVTLVIVLHLSGSITQANARGVIRWHLREIVRYFWRLFVPKGDSVGDWRHSKAWMRTLAECMNSCGVIYAALRLHRVGSLP
jgi:glucosyl-dolichyl phosphate glucuronosyltransferase